LGASSNILAQQLLKFTRSSGIEVNNGFRSVEIEGFVQLALAKSQLLKITSRSADNFQPSSDLFFVADNRYRNVLARNRLNFAGDGRVAALKEGNVVSIQNPQHGLEAVGMMKFWPLGIKFAAIDRNLL
jgi:hypothetical protein